MAGAGNFAILGMYRLPVTYSPGADWKWSFSTVKSRASSLPVTMGFKSVRGGSGQMPIMSRNCRRSSGRFFSQSPRIFDIGQRGVGDLFDFVTQIGVEEMIAAPGVVDRLAGTDAAAH